MSDIVVRLAQEEDNEGLRSVWSLTYNNGDPYPEERQLIGRPGTWTFVAELDRKIVGACNAMDMTASRGEASLRCGGVAAVAVLPEMRRAGVGSAMMSWLVRHFGDIGVPLSSLYAFREPFYRKFGYETVGRRLKIVCPTSRWPKLKCELSPRRLSPADWEQLETCYDAFARTRSGLNRRTERQWKRVLGENRDLTIYAVGDPVEAYAVVSHVTAFWTTDHISEIAWGTRRGYDSLLSVLGGIAINKTALSWFEPSDGPFYSNYLDQGIEVSVERPIMFRVHDVPGALRSMKPDCSISGEFVVDVSDEVIPSNTGFWRVKFRDGAVEVERASQGGDLRIDIRQFAQALLGEPSLDQLVGNEDVQVLSASGFEAAKRLMQPSATCCMDFF